MALLEGLVLLVSRALILQLMDCVFIVVALYS